MLGIMKKFAKAIQKFFDLPIIRWVFFLPFLLPVYIHSKEHGIMTGAAYVSMFACFFVGVWLGDAVGR